MAVAPIEGIPADEFTTSGIVKIFVSRDEMLFSVHKKLICGFSPFFLKCIENENFKEGQTGEVFLRHDNPDAFSVIVDWLYSNRVPRPGVTMLSQYLEAYKLADKCMMTACKNNIMDAIRAHNATMISTQSLLLATGEDMNEVPLLRRYLLDQYAWWFQYYPQKMLPGDGNSLLPDIRKALTGGGLFVADLLEQMIKHQRNGFRSIDPDPSKIKGCFYHHHEKDEKCTSSKF